MTAPLCDPKLWQLWVDHYGVAGACRLCALHGLRPQVKRRRADDVGREAAQRKDPSKK